MDGIGTGTLPGERFKFHCPRCGQRLNVTSKWQGGGRLSTFPAGDRHPVGAEDPNRAPAQERKPPDCRFARR